MLLLCCLTFDMNGGPSRRSLLEDVRSMEGLGDTFTRCKGSATPPEGPNATEAEHGTVAE